MRGIDYSPPGSTVNRDPDTGIRYGIIPLHALGEFAHDSFEAEYDACCPHCGEEIPDDFHFTADQRPAGKTFGCWATCPSCEKAFHEDQQYGDEPSRQKLDDGTYQGTLDSSGDAWCFKSPYYTRAAFCSPCAPGACSLNSACEDGERAYCFGHDWFDEGRAPYPVYSVATGERVLPSPEIAERDQAISPYNRIGGGK